MDLRRTGHESAGSGECGPIATWDQPSHGCSVSLDPDDFPREGEESCLTGIHQEVRIRTISAHRSRDRGGGCRAITSEAHVSHGCYTLLVGKGSGGACIVNKFIHIGGNNDYIWQGKDPVGLLASVGNGPSIAENPIPVW
jgi:hypothetical protein